MAQVKSKSMINDMTSGNLLKQMLLFAWPILVSNFLQTAYNMVDMVIVGQFVGSAGLSGVSNGGDLMLLFMFTCFGFTQAGQVIISQYVGRKDHDGINRMIGTLFVFIGLLAIAFTAVGLIGGNLFIRLVNTPQEAIGYAKDYYFTCIAGMIFTFGYNLVSCILRGMGDSSKPMLFVAIAAVINIILDLVFTAWWGMGTFGAALATVIGQAVSFIWSMIYLYKRREAFGFDFRKSSFRLDKRQMSMIFKLGLPMALQMTALSLSGLFVNSYINSYGVTVSVVTSVGNRLSNVTNMITGALGTATSTIVAQNIAAGNTKRVSRTVNYCFMIGVAAALIFGALLFFMPETIFSIFNRDPDVLALSWVYRPVGVLVFLGFALRAPYMSLISGIGFASLSLINGILDGIVLRIGLSLLMGIALDMGIFGFWYGSVFASYAPFALGIIYFYSGKWKKRKVFIE